jgi:hypothetical protein
MKLLKISLILFLLINTSISEGQSVDQIIKKYVDYIGGKKGWKQVSTLTTSGEYDYGGISFPFHTYAKAPNLYKVVVTSNGKYYAQAFDGTNGWKIDVFKNETEPTFLMGEDALAMANEADVELEDPFVNYRRKGHEAILLGTEQCHSQECFKVKFIRKGGAIETCYFSVTESELVMRTRMSKNVELQGAVLNLSYEDYRVVDGIKLPFKITSETNGQVILIITVDVVRVNTPINDREFHPQVAGKK